MCRHHARLASANDAASSGTRSATAASWRRSTSRTIATHSPSLEPKWWMSIRWLVPSSSASRRSDRSAMPRAETTAIARSSSRSRGASGAMGEDCTNWYVWCTIRYMPKPVTVSVDVPQDRERVFEFLDVMANHEPFTDHLMRDWELSGPARGVGSKARVHVRALGVSDVVDIEVVDAEAPTRIVERNVAAKAGRTAEGTYTLTPSGAGTRISFEYRWIVTPLLDRLTAPLARAYLRRANETAMRRLAEQLAARGRPAAA